VPAHRPLNFGHRGASSLAPENTLAAFRLARELGADGVELDAQLSQDGVVVIMHDDSLERTSDGHGQVRDTPWRALRRLDAGRWFDERFAGERIPTLQDVFDLLGTSLLLNIELKASTTGSELVRRVDSFVQSNRGAAHVIVSSFDWQQLEQVRACDPALRIGVLFKRELSAYHYEALKPEAIHPEHSLVTPALVAAAHSSKRSVNTWTVNSEDEMLRMIAQEVDAIITNYPQRLKDVYDRSVAGGTVL